MIRELYMKKENGEKLSRLELLSVSICYKIIPSISGGMN